MFCSFKLCRRYLHNRFRKKTILSLYQIDVQPKHAQNEKHFNSAKRIIKDELERYTTGITRVLVDVSCSSCCLSHLLASHSSQFSRVLFVQALQTSSKTNAQSLQTSIKIKKRSRVYLRKIQNFSNYRLEMMPILKIITLCRRCKPQDTTEASILPPQNTTFLQLLAGLAQRLSAFTSRCKTDKAGRGALEPPPEDGARTKRF